MNGPLDINHIVHCFIILPVLPLSRNLSNDVNDLNCQRSLAEDTHRIAARDKAGLLIKQNIDFQRSFGTFCPCLNCNWCPKKISHLSQKKKPEKLL